MYSQTFPFVTTGDGMFDPVGLFYFFSGLFGGTVVDFAEVPCNVTGDDINAIVCVTRRIILIL